MPALTIVVPLDGSPFAENAIPIALSLARSANGHVEFVSVYLEEPLITEWQISGGELRSSYAEYLEGVIERVRQHAESRAVSTVLRGPVAKALRNHVAKRDDTLVVMSTHGRGPLSRAWLGSVADRLVRHASVPVLLQRPEEDRVVDLGKSVVFQRVVVALDGSKRAEAGLAWALRLGATHDPTFMLVRAVPPRYVTSPYLPHTVQETHETLEREDADARAYLCTLQRRLANDGLAIQIEVLPGVQPGSGIPKFAQRIGADLIVVTTHGRSGLPRLVLGSVADKVVRSATVPVLIVRSSETPDGHTGEGAA